MDLSILIAEARDAHRLRGSGDGFGAIESSAAFGLVEPSVVSLLDSGLERFFAADDRGDRLVIFVPPAPPPGETARVEPATRSFLASREIFHKARLVEYAPPEWCFQVLKWAIAGPGRAAEVEVIHKPTPIPVARPIGTCDAVLSHRGPERYLRACVESLLRQSHPTRVTVGLDQKYDCRRLVGEMLNNPAVDIFQVGPSPLGPFVALHVLSRLSRADFIARHDSDDISLRRRIETLVAAAESTGAGMVGSHELQLHEILREVYPVRYPLDVSAELRAAGVRHQALLPTMITRKAIVDRVGGFSTNRIFGHDVAFWLTASLHAKILNVDEFLYLRRRRASSLTMRSDIGDYSAIRTIYREQRRQHFKEVAAGRMRLEDSCLAVRHRVSPVMFRNLRTGRARRVTLDRPETYGEPT
jgi:hypothetical protein